jgi:hypothetical protein
MRDYVLQALTTGYVPFYLFLSWAIASVVVGVTRLYEFFRVQRVPSLWLFAVVNLAQGVALFIGALVISPHPLQDFEHLRPWSRFAWAVGLPFFLLAVPVHIWYVYTVERLRKEVLLKESQMLKVELSPYESLEDK